MKLLCRRRGRFPFNERGDLGGIFKEANVEWDAFWKGDTGRAFTYAPGTDVHGNPLNPAPAPATPDPNAAQDAALSAQTAQRRAALASGSITGGSQPILGSDIHSLNLGGS